MSTAAVVLCSIFVLTEIIFVPLYLKKMWPTKNWNSLGCKMVCATAYLLLTLTIAVQTDISGSYALLMLLGFGFSWLGDLMLHIPKPTKVFFLLGMLFFGMAHVFYCMAYLKIQQKLFPGSPDFFWQEIAAAVAVTAAFLIATYSKDIHFGAMAVPLSVYSCFVSMMTIKSSELGISMLLGKDTADILPAILLLLGGILFSLSDASLGLITFDTRYKKFKLKIFNTVTYFAAQVFLAFTVLFFN